MVAATRKSEADALDRGRLSRERIIQAALQIMDHEGLDAVTMRRVAREVGVEAMSLYHHVRGKEDLLDGICTHVMRDFRYPDEDRPWIEVVRDGAREWRRVVRNHPNGIPLWTDRQGPMTELDALMPMEFALRVIDRAGMDPRQGLLVFNVLGGYIMGVVMMELGAMFPTGSSQPARTIHSCSDPAKLAENVKAHTLPPERFPYLLAALPHLAECDPDEQFEFGLDLLLAGIQATVVTPA